MDHYEGTLHIGSLCNENYRLFKSLRHLGVDAHYVHFERLAKNHYISDPRSIDEQFDESHSYIHTVPIISSNRFIQLPYELYKIGSIIHSLSNHWVHAQTDFPLYVSLFTENYSAHSSGSDLRSNYFRNNIRNKLLARAYRNAKFVFYHNIDLYRHELSTHHKHYYFIPNICDKEGIPVFSGKETIKDIENESILRIFMPSRITFYSSEDIKGNAIFFNALEFLRDLRILLFIPVEDPLSSRWVRDIESTYSNVKCHYVNSRSDKQVYYHHIQSADFVVDQFFLRAMGGVALETFFLRKIALVDVDPQAFFSCYKESFPLPELNTAQAVSDVVKKLTNEDYRRELENKISMLVDNHHEAKSVGSYYINTLLSGGVDVRRTCES